VGCTGTPLLFLACEETVKVGFAPRPPRPLSRCNCLYTSSLPVCADSTVALFWRFFLPTQTFFTLTKPRGQPRRIEEPAKAIRSNQPAPPTIRQSFILWPAGAGPNSSTTRLPMSARTIPANGEPHTGSMVHISPGRAMFSNKLRRISARMTGINAEALLDSPGRIPIGNPAQFRSSGGRHQQCLLPLVSSHRRCTKQFPSLSRSAEERSDPETFRRFERARNLRSGLPPPSLAL
jgi:hypothetical protein